MKSGTLSQTITRSLEPLVYRKGKNNKPAAVNKIQHKNIHRLTTSKRQGFANLITGLSDFLAVDQTPEKQKRKFYNEQIFHLLSETFVVGSS